MGSQFTVTTNQVAISATGGTASIAVTGSSSVEITASGIGPQGQAGPSGTIAGVVNCVTSQDLTELQSGTLFTNSGSSAPLNFNLPASPVSFTPLIYTFFVSVGQNVSVNAQSGATIQSGSDMTSVGGSFSANSQGNLLAIVLISPTKWIVTSITGIWNVQ